MAKTEQKRPIDTYFEQYAAAHQHPVNKLIHWICVPMIVFSLFGLVWAIPFPHLDFLGRYNGFINWASFLLAAVVYYYYRLSPVLSYIMLIFLMVASAGIVGLEKLHENQGWPPMWISCLIIFALSWIGQFAGHKIEGKKPSFFDDLRFLLIGPLWLLHFIFKRLGIRY
ncbi:DUF962 domain-containing protein [Pedobacter sp. BS3]|uniref:Mpo1 family 2-hydroxy fatty acid dioxygenase n=1 Tax=Pedobacter sp. BS3 TaxID=2567937 RepID=UPI0011EEB51E|nr:Mpo1-like protein [Pedobacter sp. BS3]TZF83219.1 DUF962 domain-containing protein [Pedobacter sp. BS3]